LGEVHLIRRAGTEIDATAIVNKFSGVRGTDVDVRWGDLVGSSRGWNGVVFITIDGITGNGNTNSGFGTIVERQLGLVVIINFIGGNFFTGGEEMEADIFFSDNFTEGKSISCRFNIFYARGSEWTTGFNIDNEHLSIPHGIFYWSRTITDDT